MLITVDPARREPPYQQIRQQVLASLASGDLEPGTRLPTIRQLAADLDLAVNTVARAYRELEIDGVLESRGRRGTFVRAPAAPGAAARRADELDQMARACVRDARSLGVPVADIAQAIARALAAP